jgi:hypothetical protein
MTFENWLKIMSLFMEYCDWNPSPARRRWIVGELERLSCPPDTLELAMAFRELILRDTAAPIPAEEVMRMGDIGTRLLVLGFEPDAMAYAFTYSD